MHLKFSNQEPGPVYSLLSIFVKYIDWPALSLYNMFSGLIILF